MEIDWTMVVGLGLGVGVAAVMIYGMRKSGLK